VIADTLTALAAVALAASTWLAFRLMYDDRQDEDDLVSLILSDLDEPSACAACDPGAADTGARPGIPPLPGAGSTPQAPGAGGAASAGHPAGAGSP